MLCETKICARDVVDFICNAEYQDGGVGGKVLSNKMKKAKGKKNFHVYNMLSCTEWNETERKNIFEMKICEPCIYLKPSLIQ